MPRIELAVVRSLLEELIDYDIADLEGVDVDDYDGTGNKKEHAARVNRQLNKLSDSLDLAASLVRQQYWRIRSEENGVMSTTLVPRR